MHTQTIDPYLYSRSIRGVPSAGNRVPRANASGNGWDRGLRGRTIGIAPGTEATSDGTATVKVTYADGTSIIRSANSFREKKMATKVRQHNESRRSIAECARLAPIGNVE